MSLQPTDTTDREIVQRRTFDAPRELVWKVWTDPNHVGNWWGPRGFTNTIESMEVKPGGQWRFIMHGPDGTDYPNLIVYREVDPPSRLTYAHSDEKDDGIHFFTTVTFEADGNKTNVTMTAVFPTAEARDYVVENFGAIEGGKQTLDKLGEYLAAL